MVPDFYEMKDLCSGEDSVCGLHRSTHKLTILECMCKYRLFLKINMVAERKKPHVFRSPEALCCKVYLGMIVYYTQDVPQIFVLH